MQEHSEAYLRIMERRRRRKNRKILLLIIAVVSIGGILAFHNSDKKEEPQTDPIVHIDTEKPAEPVEPEETETVTSIIPENKPVIQTSIYSFDADEEYLLAKLAMAEAEGEDVKGKALVMLIVLNRVKSQEFPNTITGVIYDKGQFSPIINGRFDSVEPDEGCWEALALVKSGWDESQDALYFEETKDRETWHSLNLEKLFVYGCHTFYTEEY